jgi:hypothetical protein
MSKEASVEASLSPPKSARAAGFPERQQAAEEGLLCQLLWAAWYMVMIHS